MTLLVGDKRVVWCMVPVSIVLIRCETETNIEIVMITSIIAF